MEELGEPQSTCLNTDPLPAVLLQPPALPCKRLWTGGSLAPNTWWSTRFTSPATRASSSWAPARGRARPTAAGLGRSPAAQVLLWAAHGKAARQAAAVIGLLCIQGCPRMSFARVGCNLGLFKHGGLLAFTKWGGIAAVPESQRANIPVVLWLPALVIWGFSSSRKAGNYSWSLTCSTAAETRGKGIGAAMAPCAVANHCTATALQHQKQPVPELGKIHGYNVPWGTKVARCMRCSCALLLQIK